MALLNILLNSLTGEIAHMNSLSNDFNTGYKVDVTLVDTHYFPFYTEITEPSQSHFWLHDLKGTEVKPKFDKSLSQLGHRNQSIAYNFVLTKLYAILAI